MKMWCVAAATKPMTMLEGSNPTLPVILGMVYGMGFTTVIRIRIVLNLLEGGC